MERGLVKKLLSLLFGLFFSGWNDMLLSPVFHDGTDNGTKVDQGCCRRPKCWHGQEGHANSCLLPLLRLCCPYLVMLVPLLSSHYEFLRRAVMTDFMCQLGWTMECLDIWSNIILCVSVGVVFG